MTSAKPLQNCDDDLMKISAQEIVCNALPVAVYLSTEAVANLAGRSKNHVENGNGFRPCRLLFLGDGDITLIPPYGIKAECRLLLNCLITQMVETDFTRDRM